MKPSTHAKRIKETKARLDSAHAALAELEEQANGALTPEELAGYEAQIDAQWESVRACSYAYAKALSDAGR